MRVFAIAFLCACLGACGFTPLYATNGQSGNISVSTIEGRAGHNLRKALLQELAPGLPGLDSSASLTIDLSEAIGRLALSPDESATRTDIIVRADYVLAFDDGAISGQSTAETSFLVPDAPFSDISAQIDATDRAMLILARRVADDLRIQMANLE
ncbi:MAG: hypothetical protein AAGL90_00970 [Pseudomonadota bacterium]